MDIRNYVNGKKEVKYLIEQLSPLIERSNHNSNIAPFDETDLELFLQEYAVAIGLDEIEGLVKDEWERRKTPYDEITDKEAKELAINALKDRFFNDGATFFKGNSLYASALDWLDEKYKLVSIHLDDCGVESIFICFDFTFATFDANSFIDSDWYWYDGSIHRLIDKMKENC